MNKRVLRTQYGTEVTVHGYADNHDGIWNGVFVDCTAHYDNGDERRWFRLDQMRPLNDEGVNFIAVMVGS